MNFRAKLISFNGNQVRSFNIWCDAGQTSPYFCHPPPQGCLLRLSSRSAAQGSYYNQLLTSRMLWGFPPGVRRAFWLCLLLHVAVATIVEDTSLSIHYDSTWLIDGNGYNSGGSAHHTNISGGTATYLFTGEFVDHHGSLPKFASALSPNAPYY